MGEPTSNDRTIEMSNLLTYGFNMYQLDTYITKDEIIKVVDVDKGLNQLNVVVKDDVSLVNKKGHIMGEITYDIQLDKLKAPINKGDIIGTLTIKEDGNVISVTPLTTYINVKKASIFVLFYRTLKGMLGVY